MYCLRLIDKLSCEQEFMQLKQFIQLGEAELSVLCTSIPIGQLIVHFLQTIQSFFLLMVNGRKSEYNPYLAPTGQKYLQKKRLVNNDITAIIQKQIKAESNITFLLSNKNTDALTFPGNKKMLPIIILPIKIVYLKYFKILCHLEETSIGFFIKNLPIKRQKS